MVSVHEVAKYIIENGTDITPKKLQKLTYYSEAWHNALLDTGLINDTHFEAWVHGPVSPELYSTYKDFGWKIIDKPIKNIDITLNDKQIEVINSVLETYDSFSGNELEAITHQEDPWKKQRVGLKETEPSNKIISKIDMKEYYQSIYIGD